MTATSSTAYHRESLSGSQVKRVQAYLEMGNLAGAERLFHVQQQLAPEAAGTFLVAGLLALAQGDSAGAQQRLERSWELAPGAAEIAMPLSHLYAALGSHERAEALLFDALSHDPNCGAAYYHLAKLAIRRHAWEMALEAAQKALELTPDNADIYNCLGIIHSRTGHLSEAEACFRRCLEAAPSTQAALLNLAALLADQERWVEALHFAAQVVVLDPSSLQAQVIYGDGLRNQGQTQAALRTYEGVLKNHPTSIAGINGKAFCMLAMNRPTAALEVYQQALTLVPDSGNLWGNAALAAISAEQYDVAEQAIARAAALAPDLASSQAMVLSAEGMLRLKQGQFLVAHDLFVRTLDQDPTFGAAYANLAFIYRQARQYKDCITLYQKAADHGVRRAELSNVAGLAQLEWGEIGQAEALFQEAYDLAPLSDLQTRALYLSNICMMTHYDPDCTLEKRDQLCQAFGLLVAPDPQAPRLSHRCQPDPARRLRVGFVSGDLGYHSVAYFLLPLLQNLDREQVEPWLYSTLFRDDGMSQQLRAASASWVEAEKLSDDQLVEKIVADEIDILIDLSGHSAHNRLPVFARRAAPIQLTWLGYPGATGVQAMDGRLVDCITDPLAENLEVERDPLIRLPRCFLAYRGPVEAPEETSAPVSEHGVFTFGSFNTVHKINGRVLDAWCEILRQVPRSRLILKAKQYADDAVRDRLSQDLRDRGIDPQRVEIITYTKSVSDHLALYGRVDLTLDTFPYNGTTTTCEALWMGVPTLTFAGDHHTARVSASLLSSLGLADVLVAKDQADYVRRAVALARNPAPLQALRPGLRARLVNSPLGDAAGLARAMEAEFRKAWQRWCAEGGMSAALMPSQGE